MATILSVSLSFCIWILLAYYFVNSFKKKHLQTRKITKFFFGLSLLTLSISFTVLGASVAYYFDFNQTYNLSFTVSVCGGFSIIGIVCGIVAFASLNQRGKG